MAYKSNNTIVRICNFFQLVVHLNFFRLSNVVTGSFSYHFVRICNDKHLTVPNFQILQNRPIISNRKPRNKFFKILNVWFQIVVNGFSNGCGFHGFQVLIYLRPEQTLCFFAIGVKRIYQNLSCNITNCKRVIDRYKRFI